MVVVIIVFVRKYFEGESRLYGLVVALSQPKHSSVTLYGSSRLMDPPSFLRLLRIHDADLVIDLDVSIAHDGADLAIPGREALGGPL